MRLVILVWFTAFTAGTALQKGDEPWAAILFAMSIVLLMTEMIVQSYKERNAAS
jgi:hypothetical protein